MTIFRNTKNKRLYKIYEGWRWYRGDKWSVDLFTGKERKLNNSSWKFEDFVPVAYR